MKIIRDNDFGVYEVPPKLMVELQSLFTSVHYSSAVNDLRLEIEGINRMHENSKGKIRALYERKS